MTGQAGQPFFLSFFITWKAPWTMHPQGFPFRFGPFLTGETLQEWSTWVQGISWPLALTICMSWGWRLGRYLDYRKRSSKAFRWTPLYASSSYLVGNFRAGFFSWLSLLLVKFYSSMYIPWYTSARRNNNNNRSGGRLLWYESCPFYRSARSFIDLDWSIRGREPCLNGG